MQHIVETVEVGAHHHIPVVFAQGGKGTVAGQAGVEHHTVISTVGVDIGFKDGLARGPVGDVELQNARGAAQRLNLGLHGGGFGQAAAAMQHDVMPGLSQAQGDSAANATAGAGDQYGFSHHSTPWVHADSELAVAAGTRSAGRWHGCQGR
ncbi:hypothetical protein D3C84_793310 [compost metagenome]